MSDGRSRSSDLKNCAAIEGVLRNVAGTECLFMLVAFLIEPHTLENDNLVDEPSTENVVLNTSL